MNILSDEPVFAIGVTLEACFENMVRMAATIVPDSISAKLIKALVEMPNRTVSSRAAGTKTSTCPIQTMIPASAERKNASVRDIVRR